MKKQVGFEYQRTDTADITIIDIETNKEIDDINLFNNILNEISEIICINETIEHEFNEKKYQIVIETYKEDTMYIGFETY